MTSSMIAAMQCLQRTQKMISAFLAAELHIVVSHRVGAGN